MKSRAFRKIPRHLLNTALASKMPPSSAEITATMTEFDSLLHGRKNGCCLWRVRFNGPDGARSWLVAFANFLINFIIVGLGRMGGIFYVEFMNMFNIDRFTASIPFSVQQIGRNLFGPMAGILGQKYALREVTILGGLLGALSGITMYFRLDVTSATLMWGLMFGISTALTTTLNQLSINQYFEKHKTTAGGFAYSGGCIGALVFPFLLEILFENYGMKGTFLIIGCIVLFVLPCAMMLVEPPWRYEAVTESVPQLQTSQYGATDPEKVKTETKYPVDVVKQIDHKNSLIDFAVLKNNEELVYKMLTIDMPGQNDKTDTGKSEPPLDKERLMNELEFMYLSAVTEDTEEKVESDGKKKKRGFAHFNFESSEHKISNKEYDDAPRRLYIQKKLRELYEARGTQLVSYFPYIDQIRAWKVLTELKRLFEILGGSYEFKKPPVIQNSQVLIRETKILPDKIDDCNTLWNHIKTAVKLHGNPLFLLICLCRAVFLLSFFPVATVIVDYAVDKGLHKSEGKYLIVTLSLGDFIGRLCLGWITDHGFMSMPRYMLVFMILLGVSTATLPLATSELTIMSSVILFAVLQGSLFVRHPVLISHYMETHEQAIGMGFINLLSGLLGFAMPSFIGYFRDVLGSYDKMFYINGGICAGVGVLWIFEPLLVRLTTKKLKKKGGELT